MRYHKLVRDKIPEIIKNKGEKTVTHRASDKEYWQKLKEKLKEEVEEFIEEENPEELADIMEIIEFICIYKKIDKKVLEELKQKKTKERGSFKDKIILEETK